MLTIDELKTLLADLVIQVRTMEIKVAKLTAEIEALKKPAQA